MSHSEREGMAEGKEQKTGNRNPSFKQSFVFFNLLSVYKKTFSSGSSESTERGTEEDRVTGQRPKGLAPAVFELIVLSFIFR